MAKKRAQIDMTLTVTGASDCFEQDIEDLPEDYLDQREQPQQRQAPAKTAYAADAFKANFPSWEALIKGGAKTADEIIAKLVTKFTLSEEQLKKIREVKKTAAPAEESGESAPAEEGAE